MTDNLRWPALKRGMDLLFRDHEIFIRTGGEVRFWRVSAQSQRRVALVAATALGVWATATVGMVGWQAYSSWHNRDIIARAAAVQAAEARVAASRDRVARTTGELGARQQQLEAIISELGADMPAEAGTPTAPTAPSASGPATAPSTAVVPASTSITPAGDEISQLRSIEQRQQATVTRLASLFAQRSARAEAALQKVGIRAPSQGSAQGGPFVAARSGTAADRSMRNLLSGFARMRQLEELVMSLPSFTPAQVERMSSGFGYRRDPFNGGGAMHTGLDFTGGHGSPILAAAPGIVRFAGVQSGYGNTVEIDHGFGIMTRYAHLSGFAARVGDRVVPGQQIARMGSSGRSTGTHLHFEVRVNGQAVNPRRFLEGNADVLQIQASANGRRAPRRPDDAA